MCRSRYTCIRLCVEISTCTCWRPCNLPRTGLPAMMAAAVVTVVETVPAGAPRAGRRGSAAPTPTTVAGSSRRRPPRRPRRCPRRRSPAMTSTRIGSTEKRGETSRAWGRSRRCSGAPRATAMLLGREEGLSRISRAGSRRLLRVVNLNRHRPTREALNYRGATS